MGKIKLGKIEIIIIIVLLLIVLNHYGIINFNNLFSISPTLPPQTIAEGIGGGG